MHPPHTSSIHPSILMHSRLLDFLQPSACDRACVCARSNDVRHANRPPQRVLIGAIQTIVQVHNLFAAVAVCRSRFYNARRLTKSIADRLTREAPHVRCPSHCACACSPQCTFLVKRTHKSTGPSAWDYKLGPHGATTPGDTMRLMSVI